MSKVVTLTKTEYLIGHLQEDLNPLVEMILSNHKEGRNMSKDITNIRYEDIRINFTKIISDCYINVSDGIDSNLQIYGCLSRMIKYIIETSNI